MHLSEHLPDYIRAIVEVAERSPFLDSLHLKNIDTYDMKLCCRAVAKEITGLENFNKAVVAQQGSEIWQQERQLRITGLLLMKYSLKCKSQDHNNTNKILKVSQI